VGCFDTISIFCECPYCGRIQLFDAQTKDLGRGMYYYSALNQDWFNEDAFMGKEFREGFPVFPKFPNDKSYKVWKNQAEKTEAAATVPDEFQNLDFVEVITGCKSLECWVWAKERDKRIQGVFSGFGRHFRGKLTIQNGKLIQPLFDIERVDDELPEPREHTPQTKGGDGE